MEKKLTAREQEIKGMLLDGEPVKEIALKLKISVKTVEFHKNNLYRKLGIRTLQQLYKITYSSQTKGDI